jgi:hypothetical protein
MYFLQQCYIFRPSDFIVSENARAEPRTVATLALAVSRSNHSARSHPAKLKIYMNFNYYKMEPSHSTSGAERIGGEEVGSEGRIGARQQSPHGAATVQALRSYG